MMGGLGNAKIDGTPFNVLMQQAVKLKTHIHKVDRVKFDRWPKFYQNSAFVRDEQREERKLAYEERMAKAREYKAEADGFFKRGDWLQAGLNYEWALGLWKWATPLDPNWRKKSVEDNEMKEEVFEGEGDHDAIRVFRVACLLNLAKTYFKQREFVTARQACDWALGLDGTCAKALLIRAKCLVTPASHGASDRDAAISDLELAEKLVLENVSSKEEAWTVEVKTTLAKLRRERSLGKKADKKYGGLFDRGEIYDADETHKRRRPFMEAAGGGKENSDPASASSSSRDAGCLDDEFFEKAPLEAQLNAAQRLLEQYEDEGRTEDAAELRKALDATRAKMAAGPGCPKPDFRNPTQEMKDDAKSRGIDLDDPAVVDMLEQLQAEREAEPDDLAAKTAAVRRMSMSEIMAELDANKVDRSNCRNKDDLADLLVNIREASSSSGQNKKKSVSFDPASFKAPPRPYPKQKPFAASWTFTFIVSCVLLAIRLYTSNIARPLYRSIVHGEPLHPHSSSSSSKEAPSDDILPGAFDREDDEWFDDEF